MRNSWNIALWKTRWMLKEKGTWLNLFILPILFAVIFGGMQADGNTTSEDFKAKVGIIQHTTNVELDLLQDVLGQQLNAAIVAFETKDQAKHALENGEISALVLWPKDFENTWAKQKKTTWQFQYEKQNAQNFMMEQKMQQWIISINGITMMEELNSTYSPKQQVEKWLNTWKNYRDSTMGVTVQYGHTTQEETTSFSRVFVGFSLMFLMFALNQSAATILEEREMGTWNRLLMSPLHKTEIILGNVWHFLLLGLIQFSVLMAFSSIVFDVQWGHYIDTFLFATLVILTVSGLGFMLATFVRTKAQQNIFGALIITLTSMLGGVYWPLSFVSETMRAIANFIPQKWAMEGFIHLMSGGYRLWDIQAPILMLFVFLTVFYIIGVLRVRTGGNEY